MKRNPYKKITEGDKKPKKEISEISTKKSHDGKMVHTHRHHRPEHHSDETYVSNNMDEMAAHMAKHEPMMTAAPSPMPSDEDGDEGAGGAAAGGAGGAMPPAAM
jgi:hypothetical protein